MSRSALCVVCGNMVAVQDGQQGHCRIHSRSPERLGGAKMANAKVAETLALTHTGGVTARDEIHDEMFDRIPWYRSRADRSLSDTNSQSHYVTLHTMLFYTIQ